MCKLHRLAMKIIIVTAVLIMAQTASAITFAEFLVPTTSSEPLRISLGPDGNLWFTEYSGNNIGRITTGGVIMEVPIPTANSEPGVITTGPDGNLWFTEEGGNKIGQISTAGVVLNEFLVPTPGSAPDTITQGPDGNLWFTEKDGNNIARITTSGVITEFPIPTANSAPTALRTGPDGKIWFTEEDGNKIGEISTAGVVLNEFPIPTANSEPHSIHIGPDGSLWFTEGTGNKIGRITTAGVITEFLLPLVGEEPQVIRIGPDGNLWFTVRGTNGNKIDQAVIENTVSGTSVVITEFTIPTASSGPGNVVIGSDGNLWFTEETSNKIGRATINTGVIPVPSSDQFLSVTPPVGPIINSSLDQAAPFGIDSIATGGSIFSPQIGLGPFSGPVDIYAAFTLSTAPGYIDFLNPDGESFQTFTMDQILQALSTGVLPAGLVPWISNTSDGIYDELFEGSPIPISQIPAGSYNVYIAVFPAGSLSPYYIWQTSFSQ